QPQRFQLWSRVGQVQPRQRDRKKKETGESLIDPSL
ncbi:uncharacterized, partial [Tachysurus ichikawai]